VHCGSVACGEMGFGSGGTPIPSPSTLYTSPLMTKLMGPRRPRAGPGPGQQPCIADLPYPTIQRIPWPAASRCCTNWCPPRSPHKPLHRYTEKASLAAMPDTLVQRRRPALGRARRDQASAPRVQGSFGCSRPRQEGENVTRMRMRMRRRRRRR